MLSPKSTHQGNNRGAFPFCLGPVLSRPCCFSDDSNRISSTSDISDSIFSHGSSIFAVSCGNLFTVVQT
uniref:Uncharacterized protein n=1 Tax=Arundo donax TaxID=35708 RepID=A0A0A8XU17_ARUDO